MMTQALKFPLPSLREAVTPVRLSLSAAELELPVKILRYRGPVEVTLELARAGERVHVRGEARVAIEVACVRCLAPIETDMRAEIELVARPRPNDETQQDIDGEFLYYDGDALDLAEAVREALVLEIPSNPICRRDCRGLCPRCGADLNAGDCRCAEQGVRDPRWSALASLRPDGESKSRDPRVEEPDSDQKGS